VKQQRIADFKNEVNMQKPVTELAVKRRLNRRLAEKGECLRKCSTARPGGTNSATITLPR
jgi:hypothetical protein